MARPGEIEQRAPAQEQQGAQEATPHGEGADLERLQGAAPVARQRPVVVAKTPERQASLNEVLASVAPQMPEAPVLPPDQNGGFDQALFSPTDRPNEPVTHGAPFGPGANFVPGPAEDDHAFMVRVAQVLQSSPSATSDVRSFATRVMRGE